MMAVAGLGGSGCDQTFVHFGSVLLSGEKPRRGLRIPPAQLKSQTHGLERCMQPGLALP